MRKPQVPSVVPDTDKLSVKEKLAVARLLAVEKRPYFSRAIYALSFVEVPEVESANEDDKLDWMAIDQFYRCYYNPGWVAKASTSPSTLAWVILHEVDHLVRLHFERIMDRLPKRWNYGGDLEINDDLLSQLGDPGLPVCYPKNFSVPNGQTAEQYYDLIKDRFKEIKIVISHGGSGSDGISRPWELGPGDSKSPGVQGVERELVSRYVAQETLRHMSSGGIGTVPGGLKRWAESFLSPKVPWATELAAVVRATLETTSQRGADTSYRTPSRRQHMFDGIPEMEGIVLAGEIGAVPSVAIAIDTSGSMSLEQLAQGLAEIDGVLQHYDDVAVQVFSVDAAVSTVQSVFSAREVNLTGGGGTDMGQAVKEFAKLVPPPNIGIIFTDGHTPWPSTVPDETEVIVVIHGTGDGPPWGRTIRIN